MSFENKILQGDAITKLKELPSGSINCVMTSPPYFPIIMPKPIKPYKEKQMKQAHNQSYTPQW